MAIALLWLLIGSGGVLQSALGASWAWATERCEERCPGDDAEGHCPPGCTACACCPGVLPAIVPGTAAALAGGGAQPCAGDRPSPPHSDISHRIFRPPRQGA